MYKIQNIRSGRRRPLLYAMVICALAPAGALGQHVHGVIELGVVVEGSTVAVSLDAPLSDVVGFEHAPENDEQLELIRQAAALLSNQDAMFGLPDSASCTISDTSIDGPAYVLEHLAEDAAGAVLSDHDDHDGHEESAEHDHDEHEESAVHDHDEHEEAADHDHDEHEEAAGHDHDEHEESADHDHDGHEESADHEHDDAEQHSEVNANYQWECRSASDLDSLALRFTESFAGVETIEIQILTAAGAQVLTLEGRATSVSLSQP